MPRFVGWILPLLVVALAGCHVMAPKVAEESGPGHVRVDQAFAVALRPVLAATLAVLDELEVKPQKLAIESGIATPGGQPMLGIEPEATNIAMLPDGARADDIFNRHELNMPGTPSTPFHPIFAAYQGKTADGRTVVITIATKRGNDADNLVTVRIGHRSDDAWNRAFLAKIAARVDAPNPTVAP